MDTYSPQIAKMIKCFKKLPNVGAKSAEKMAFSIVNMSEKDVEDFAASLIAIKRELHHCPICQNWTNEDKCPVCASSFRNQKVIMVVESPRDVVSFERSGAFNGVYHILHGLINPKDRIGMEDIKLRELFERLKGEVDEVILALSPTYEGEVTSNKIKQLLNGSGIKITELAQGVPIGSGIDSVDIGTLERALNGRTNAN